jgi:hypothetical protein
MVLFTYQVNLLSRLGKQYWIDLPLLSECLKGSSGYTQNLIRTSVSGGEAVAKGFICDFAKEEVKNRMRSKLKTSSSIQNVTTIIY